MRMNNLRSTAVDNMCNEDQSKLLDFLHFVGQLKNVKRTGWVLRKVESPECVAGHMYRMGMLTFLLDGKDGLDKNSCLKLALVHDLAECIVGDITPKCGITPEEKHRREDEAMQQLAKLAGSAGDEIYHLYKEYEMQNTPEAKLVKELDRFDMILQAFEYEKAENRPHDLQEFFDCTVGKFKHPLVSALVSELHKRRHAFEEETSASNHLVNSESPGDKNTLV